MTEPTKTFVTDKSTPGHWRVTLNNPPINLLDDAMYDAFYDLVGEVEADSTLKVVTFESAHPDFFLAHYGASGQKSRFGVPRWIDAARRIAESSVLSIAVIRGRVRGGGSEFAMGLDIRFASREKAIFGQPEIGTGLIPGGGALQRLPLLVGRARALEVVLGADDYSADVAERYGWINRAIPEADLDGFVANFVRRVLSFDKQALATAKSIINASGGLPSHSQLQSTQDLFFGAYGWEGFKKRVPVLRERGIGQAGDFELHLGHNLGELGVK
ncbi:MAG TPA: enoyl-CoA hydratase/isomerase family protein [Kofleriaceae bacterium]|jgi:enoyl-CoA hydratase/carnithine racemase